MQSYAAVLAGGVDVKAAADEQPHAAAAVPPQHLGARGAWSAGPPHSDAAAAARRAAARRDLQVQAAGPRASRGGRRR